MQHYGVGCSDFARIPNQASVRPMVGQACKTGAAPLSGVNVPGFPIGVYCNVQGRLSRKTDRR